MAVAIIGPDSSAANLAPWLVPVVWWVGLPIVCLLLGDVVRHLNPFVPVVALLDRGRRRDPDAPAPVVDRRPSFLAAWSWYLLAYHQPGSPRALAVVPRSPTRVAAVGGRTGGGDGAGSRTGEAFGALSAAVARIGVRGLARAAAGPRARPR